MPYIRNPLRPMLDRGGAPQNAGQLTYCLMRRLIEHQSDAVMPLCINYCSGENANHCFQRMCEVLGALSATGLEMTRRTGQQSYKALMRVYSEEFYNKVVAPYEDGKCSQNGDVF